ncbi:diguanylate cyclase [Halothiobacillus sp. DCM-1]|uniref:GGDEF domain-containing protein n=1 Tax=Halothiobacillus sp. DCM-1 TaxID=3112558 RepID=UPI00324C3934
MSDTAKPSVDYRARYEQLLSEFSALETTEQRQQQLLRALLGRVLFAIDKAYPNLASKAQALRDLMRQTGDAPLPLDKLQPGIEALTEAIRLEEARNLTPDPHEQAVTEDPEARTEKAAVREFLPLLLERIAFTDLMEARRAKLLEIINDPRDTTLNSILIDRAACLINEMRRALENEKSELAEFLQQLTDALREIDQHTQLNLGDIQNQRAAHDALNKAVTAQVTDIDQTVDKATDLAELKKAVRARIARISEHIDRFRQTEEARMTEVEEENEAMRARIQKLEQSRASLQEQLEASTQRMLRDTLTGLPNRLAFDERLSLEVARMRREGTPLCLAIWDIDHFKRVNDTYGHQAGDKALIVVGKTLHHLIRDVDMAARYGGEEFVMLLPRANLQQAFVVLERIREKIAATPFRFKDQPLKITLSCGVAEFAPEEDSEAVMARADEALYRAKGKGRNRTEMALR